MENDAIRMYKIIVSRLVRDIHKKNFWFKLDKDGNTKMNLLLVE